MKTLIRLFAVACLLSQHSGFAATTFARSESMMCTFDLNPWGHGSSCSCPKNAKYDARAGFCVTGEKETILTQGVLHTNIMAIGAETTGITLETENGSYELILKVADRKKLSARGNGLYFEVEGEITYLSAVEMASRPAIIVNNISWLEY